MRVRVSAHGVGNVKARIGAYAAKKQVALRKIVAKAALNIQKEARRRAPVDTGRLRSAIVPSFGNGGLLAIIAARTNYAAFVEFGTSPHFPPPVALTGWARRHGMAGMEFPIARAIARRGTPAQPFLFPAFEQERPRFLAEIIAEMKRL
mgnify:CR=1 FL=1